MRTFLDAFDEPDVHRVIEYRLADGSSSSFAIAQMVQHVVNHKSYHRGQLTTMYRLLGVEPTAGHGLDEVLARASRDAVSDFAAITELSALWHRLLRWPVSESGRLRCGNEPTGAAIAAGRVRELATLPQSRLWPKLLHAG